MKKVLIFSNLIFLVISYFKVYSQQEPQFSQNVFNILSFNPGYAGSNNQICLNTINRLQWIGFKETNPDGQTYNVSPQTFLVSIDAYMRPIYGGLGLIIYKDKLGHEDNIGLRFGYAYRRVFGEGQIGIGLMGGFLNKTINYAGFFPIDENDPLLQGNKESDMIFDIAGGLYYKVPGKWFAGISSSQILQSKSDFQSSVVLASPKLKRHYYLIGGYQFKPSILPDFEFQPSLFIKTDFASTQYDINLMATYLSQFWAGFSYRHVDALVFIVGAYPFLNSGTKAESLRVSFAYDLTTSSLGYKGRSFGSTELHIGYCFMIKIERPEEIYRNVIFL